MKITLYEIIYMVIENYDMFRECLPFRCMMISNTERAREHMLNGRLASTQLISAEITVAEVQLFESPFAHKYQ